MPSNRKSYNGAYNVPTKGKAEQEMTHGNGGANGKPAGVGSPSSNGKSTGKSSGHKY